jgi:hypothetical protein
VHAPQLLSNLNFTNALRLADNLGAARSDERGYRRSDAGALDALSADLAHLAKLARRSHEGV